MTLITLKYDGSNADQVAAGSSKTGLVTSVMSNSGPMKDGRFYRRIALEELDRRGEGHRISAKVRREVEALGQ